MKDSLVKEFVTLLENSIEISGNQVKVLKPDVVKKYARKLAEISALEKGSRSGAARYITRLIAQQLGIVPASIHDLYIARGTGEVKPTFTVPAINLRQMTFDCATAIFRAARKLDAGAIIFEIARSEMSYTDQRPTEFTTSILAAAIAEEYRGPIFMQGDHFQVKVKAFLTDPEKELDALKSLMREVIAAGWFNIDVDTSTLVDLDKKTLPEQQKVNVELSAMFTKFLREQQPEGVVISVGGEIGEVGGHNSTVEELHAYLDGYQAELKKLDPAAIGLSKVSIQTGTSHGGIVLPDGTMASVNVDFGCLKELGDVAKEYGLGGAVQHGASTLPEDAFDNFVKSEALEIHLATNFTNMYYDHMPAELRAEIYQYIEKAHASDRKSDMTDEQFYYKLRKNGIGPFKKQSWNMPVNVRNGLVDAWEAQFVKLFTLLGLKGTKQIVEKSVHPFAVSPLENDYFSGDATGETDVSDLAD
jgi:fructose/tagatose bisphosphate aldolase